MTEPLLFQQQREIWREFRQAVARRRQKEKEATQRWQKEQLEADRALEHTLNEAKKRRDQEEQRSMQQHQRVLQDASNERDQFQHQAKQALQQAENEIQKRYQSERRQANLVLERVKKEAHERQTREESEAQERYFAEVETTENALKRAKTLAKEKEERAKGHWFQCQSYLGRAELPLHQLIPVEILPASRIEMRGDEDPLQALEQSLERVSRVSKALHEAVDDLLRWRETRQRRRNWAIGLVMVTTFAVLIGMSIRNAQIQKMNRQATETAFHPTLIAMVTRTAQARANEAQQVYSYTLTAVGYIAEGQIYPARSILVNKVIKWFYETPEPTDEIAQISFQKARWWTEEAIRHIERGSPIHAREALEKIVIPWFERLGVAVAQSSNVNLDTAMTQATAMAQAETVVHILAARTPSKRVAVYADKGWQDTGMFVVANETVEISYDSGKWCTWACAGGTDSVPPTIRNPSEGILPDVGWDAIIARIGDQGPFPVLGETSMTAQTTGFVELRINDPDVRDNTGSVFVNIRIK